MFDLQQTHGRIIEFLNFLFSWNFTDAQKSWAKKKHKKKWSDLEEE